MAKRLNLQSINNSGTEPALLKKVLASKKTKIASKADDSRYFISSGCHNVNLALTGHLYRGYPKGRIIVIKGGHSSGKTVTLVEAINSLHYIDGRLKGKKVASRYNDAEAALDSEFSKDLNLPEETELVDPPTETVEELHQDIFDFIQRHKDADLLLYGVDSIDALMVREETEEIKKNLNKIKKHRLKAIGEKLEEEKKETKEGDEEKSSGSYGAQKAKYMSKFFRDLARKLKKTNCILFIVAQLRDDLKKKYGNTTSMSGGKAAGYYASQILDINKIETLKKTKDSPVPYGSKCRLIVEKNKVWRDKRKAIFDIISNPVSGIDNYGAMVDFMVEQKEIPYSMGRYTWKEKSYRRDDMIKFFFQNSDDWKELLEAAQLVWNNIEESCCVERGNKWENMLFE